MHTPACALGNAPSKIGKASWQPRSRECEQAACTPPTWVNRSFWSQVLLFGLAIWPALAHLNAGSREAKPATPFSLLVEFIVKPPADHTNNALRHFLLQAPPAPSLTSLHQIYSRAPALGFNPDVPTADPRHGTLPCAARAARLRRVCGSTAASACAPASPTRFTWSSSTSRPLGLLSPSAKCTTLAASRQSSICLGP